VAQALLPERCCCEHTASRGGATTNEPAAPDLDLVAGLADCGYIETADLISF
jgi:hypothetical protein